VAIDLENDEVKEKKYMTCLNENCWKMMKLKVQMLGKIHYLERCLLGNGVLAAFELICFVLGRMRLIESECTVTSSYYMIDAFFGNALVIFVIAQVYLNVTLVLKYYLKVKPE
jgi:hypothetical protein